MRKVFILDDYRNIQKAFDDAGIKRESDDLICLARPFRSMGVPGANCNFDTPIDIITSNIKFDIWILDNDLGTDTCDNPVEGYRFLVMMIDKYPDLVADTVVSCSANMARRIGINEYHAGWMKYKD
jgi:hypothetical protein